MSQKAKHKLILDELERLNQTTTTPVYVPTLNAVIDFKEITIKQQKDIITSALDALLTNTVFNNTVNNIVKNNIITEPEHIQNLTTVDRLPIIISLRKQSLGADVLIKTDTDSYNINIEEHIKKFPSIKLGKLKLNDVITDRDISVDVSVPRLKKDSKVNDAAKAIIDSTAGNRYVNSLGQLFVFEIVKYIDTIKANNIEINFNTAPITQCVAIVEKLPMSVSKQILKFIHTIKRYEEKFLTVKHDKTTTTLSIDATFFNNE